jgi:surface protein
MVRYVWRGVLMLASRVRMGSRKKYIDEVYLAQDSDFVKVNNRWVYRGSELEIEIPHTIQGEEITSYYNMFNGLMSYVSVTRVVSNNKNITNMGSMFRDSQATSLDLSNFDTSNVTNMSNMFNGSEATSLDLSSFDTSNVTNMNSMFRYARATIGYARTQADADRFNASSNKPPGLVFVVK